MLNRYNVTLAPNRLAETPVTVGVFATSKPNAWARACEVQCYPSNERPLASSIVLVKPTLAF
jgi:hypothetical protein